MKSKIEFSDYVKVSLGKLTQSKSLLLNQVLSSKAISLLLNYI